MDRTSESRIAERVEIVSERLDRELGDFTRDECLEFLKRMVESLTRRIEFIEEDNDIF